MNIILCQSRIIKRCIKELEQTGMIVKKGGMMFVEFAEYFSNDGFTHEFRFVLNPKLPAILINGF